MNKKIVAIGGGENGRVGYPYETAEIDSAIVSLSNKQNPKVLFIGTASGDSLGYYGCIKRMFGDNLNCQTDNLRLLEENYTKEEIEEKIMSADIIYVGGGNTRKMLNKWKETGVDRLFQTVYEKGAILSGLSAGSVCWFKYFTSDSDIMDGISSDYILLEGLGIINAIHCPHFDVEEERRETLKNLMLRIDEPIVAIAIDNCAAIEIIDNKYRIITSKDKAKAYKTYWLDGQYYEEVIPQKEVYQDFEELIKHSKSCSIKI